MNTRKESPIVVITNCTSLQNREDVIEELGDPQNGFFKPLPFMYKNMRGEIIAIDMQPNDPLEKSGFEKGKKAMLNSVEDAVNRGAKVICFTASTKRLPGRFGRDIKKLYPNIIFTIGDNATCISFIALVNHFLSPLDKENDLIVSLGAGFLGEQAIKTFIKHGFKKIVLLSEQKIDYFPPEVLIVNSLEKLPTNIKLLVCCSHKYQINPQTFKNLFAESAIIVDVSVPQGINFEVYKALPVGVKRYDGGDFYLSGIHYGFNSKLLSFPGPHFWYGCFTEETVLNKALLDGHDLNKYNFFEINEENQKFLNQCLRQEKVQIPLINFFNPVNGNTIPF